MVLVVIYIHKHLLLPHFRLCLKVEKFQYIENKVPSKHLYYIYINLLIESIVKSAPFHPLRTSAIENKNPQGNK